MPEARLYSALLAISFILAGATFVALFFINAPYGRHARNHVGPSMSNRVSWLVMEAPAALLLLVLFMGGSVQKSLTLVVFLLMWEAHYLHRAFIYPFRIADGYKRMPVLVLLFGFVFNSGNAYLNGVYLFSLSGGYPTDWLVTLRFIAGLVLFTGGYAVNRWADRKLRLLRQPGKTGYQIPTGGLFKQVSCPNYLGEIIEWSGWALATWSLPGLSFAVWTVANLLPRARAHHTWYLENFTEYPKERKALIPGIW